VNSGLPTLAETARGCTVEYRNRFLYSRYDPEKNPTLTTASVNIPPETLILCISPLLGYGISLLLEKLPDNCMILALEADEQLMQFSVQHMHPSILSNPKFKYIRTNSPDLAAREAAVLPNGPFRRCLRLDMSGGASLHEEFYAEAVSAIDGWISGFWKNRVTLMKLGRNYARNLFRNCAALGKANPLQFNSIRRPVFVLGAGPSAEAALSFLRTNRQDVFLLAVDTAYPMLAETSLRPDAIVILESQIWIERSFIGARGTKIPVIADMTARQGAFAPVRGTASFFFTEYADSSFTRRFKAASFAPPDLPAMGSVGLAALLLGRKLAMDGIPVFAAGLDFSWGKAFSHARGTTPVREIHASSTRYSPASAACPSLKTGAFKTESSGKDEANSDPALSGYADLCRKFAKAGYFPYCFAVSVSGLDIGLPVIDPSEIRLPVFCTDSTAGDAPFATGSSSGCEEARAFLEAELARLVELKDLLTGNTQCSSEDRAERIEELAVCMDYLYLHFPDGHRGFSREAAFLKRVRAETEVFIKTVRNALNDLNKTER